MDELLKYAIENGIINLTNVQEEIVMKKRNNFLKSHPYEIWLGNDGYWRTYLPKMNGGRKLVKKKEEADINDAVIDFWESQYINTFKKRFDIWVERQRACGRSDNTIYKYEKDYQRFFKGDIIEDMDIRNITDEEIGLFIQRLLNQKDVPYKALQSMFGYINGMFEKAIKDKIIKENPCKYVDLEIFKKYCKAPKTKTTEQRTLSAKEKEVLLSKVQKRDSVTKGAVELALYTGMRVGELSALRWSDINYQKGIITVRNSEKHNRKTNEFYISSTKNDKIRQIPLTNDIIDVLKRIKSESMRLGVLGEFVFCNKNGRIHARTISDCARNNTMTKEFSNTKSIHAIRRTLNSNLKVMGVSSTVAAAILGHTERVNDANYTYDVSSMAEKKGYLECAGRIK